MDVHRAINVVERQQWVKQADKVMRQTVGKAIARRGEGSHRINNLLNGTWLGHPLHPVLSDIPTGTWTAALVLDMLEVTTRRREFGTGADAAVGIGIAGAVGSAVSGVADWQHLVGRSSRIGTLHALLNVGALLLYVNSLVLRRSGSRSGGRALGLLGWLVMNASAYLGGDLVYSERVGVDHSDKEHLPRKFQPVMDEADLPENTLHRADLNGAPILLVRTNGRIYALAETCAHLGGPLADGKLINGSVVCPWHGSEFALDDGRILNGPSAFPQPCLETRIRDGKIEVRLDR